MLCCPEGSSYGIPLMLWRAVTCAFKAFKSLFCNLVALFLFLLALSEDFSRVLWEIKCGLQLSPGIRF